MMELETRFAVLPFEHGCEPLVVHPSIVRELTTSDEYQILSKTKNLFADRLVLGLAKLYLPHEIYEEWLRHALLIQLSIYRIDSYYEQSPSLRTAEEAPLWVGVERKLSEGPCRSSEIAW